MEPPMFDPTTDPDVLNRVHQNTMISHLGIEVTAIGEDYITARMPVADHTKQPMGLLHGGASVALAESLGSMASALLLDLTRFAPVGLEINANHIRSVTDGYVYGTVRPIHIGQRTHVWEIRIVDDRDRLVCVSRLTVMVVPRSS
ncbi:MAG: hotdog fold thioesterase [Anaerolineae bacterium]|nr:hotdog fold thioesterase [Anaerolineae bacterium]